MAPVAILARDGPSSGAPCRSASNGAAWRPSTSARRRPTRCPSSARRGHDPGRSSGSLVVGRCVAHVRRSRGEHEDGRAATSTRNTRLHDDPGEPEQPAPAVHRHPRPRDAPDPDRRVNGRDGRSGAATSTHSFTSGLPNPAPELQRGDRDGARDERRGREQDEVLLERRRWPRGRSGRGAPRGWAAGLLGRPDRGRRARGACSRPRRSRTAPASPRPAPPAGRAPASRAPSARRPCGRVYRRRRAGTR